MEAATIASTNESISGMITELLLWHALSKQDLARLLNLPIRVINGMLFKGQATPQVEILLYQLCQRYRAYGSID